MSWNANDTILPAIQDGSIQEGILICAIEKHVVVGWISEWRALNGWLPQNVLERFRQWDVEHRLTRSWDEVYHTILQMCLSEKSANCAMWTKELMEKLSRLPATDDEDESETDQ